MVDKPENKISASDEEDVLGTILRIISHGVNTPLTSIRAELAMMRMLPDAKLTKEQILHLTRVDLAAGKLGRLAMNIGYALQARDGKIQAKPVLQKTEGAIQSALFGLKRRAGRIDIPFHDNLEASEIFVDPRHLRFVIETILTNSIRYSPEGGQINVSGRIEGDEYWLEISDEGPGIHLDLRADIFDIFDTAGLEHSTSQAGAGLGLFVCKSLVDANGAQISIVDGPSGKGTTVRIRLPTKDGQKIQ